MTKSVNSNHRLQSATILEHQSFAMAALLVAKRATSLSTALQKLLSTPARPLAVSAPDAMRSFNTNAQAHEDDDGDDRDLGIQRRSGDRAVSRRRYGDGAVSRRRADGYPAQISDVLDPFVPRTISQLLNMMDTVFEGPFSTAGRPAGGFRRGWDAREDDDALHLRIDMPGLGKENVKVVGDNGTLVIRGEGEAEEGDEENRRRYSTRIDVSPELYKLDAIKAEMKNGVLKVVVPKVKETDRKDVFEVNIE